MCIWVPVEPGVAGLASYHYDGARDDDERSSYGAWSDEAQYDAPGMKFVVRIEDERGRLYSNRKDLGRPLGPRYGLLLVCFKESMLVRSKRPI